MAPAPAPRTSPSPSLSCYLSCPSHGVPARVSPRDAWRLCFQSLLPDPPPRRLPDLDNMQYETTHPPPSPDLLRSKPPGSPPSQKPKLNPPLPLSQLALPFLPFPAFLLVVHTNRASLVCSAPDLHPTTAANKPPSPPCQQHNQQHTHSTAAPQHSTAARNHTDSLSFRGACRAVHAGKKRNWLRRSGQARLCSLLLKDGRAAGARARHHAHPPPPLCSFSRSGPAALLATRPVLSCPAPSL